MVPSTHVLLLMFSASCIHYQVPNDAVSLGPDVLNSFFLCLMQSCIPISLFPCCMLPSVLSVNISTNNSPVITWSNQFICLFPIVSANLYSLVPYFGLIHQSCISKLILLGCLNVNFRLIYIFCDVKCSPFYFVQICSFP